MPWLFSSFLTALSKTSANEWMKKGESRHPCLTLRLKEKSSEDQPVLDTTVQNNLNHVTNDTPKFKYYKVLSIKGHFMLSKAFSKSMKSRKPGICFVFAYLMMLSTSLIFSPIFSLFYFSENRDDLRKNIFNAISKWFSRWRVMGFQFFRRLADLFVLGTRVISPLFCVIDYRNYCIALSLLGFVCLFVCLSVFLYIC